MPIEFVNAADLIIPGDPHGRTYRQRNMEKNHAIPIGTLVELEGGARAWVVSHQRDCDGTPLYSLSLDREDTDWETPGRFNHTWSNGYGEESLTPVPA